MVRQEREWLVRGFVSQGVLQSGHEELRALHSCVSTQNPRVATGETSAMKYLNYFIRWVLNQRVNTDEFQICLGVV